MKTIISITVLTFLLLNGFSQNVPNPGFEAWIDYGAYEDPKNWNSPNEATSGLNVFTVTKSTDVYAGNYAVKLESKNILGGVFKVPGTITLGEFDINFNNQTAEIVGGVPFSSRPDKFKGQFKYFPKQSDFMEAVVLLYKYDQATGLRDTLGQGHFSTADTVDAWMPFEMDIMYSSFEEPDSLNIIIVASDAFNAVQGSTLHVDSLMFEYATGLEESIFEHGQAKVYPNPCDQQITFEIPENWENTLISIFNAKGKAIHSGEFRNRNAIFQTLSYPNGTYFYQLVSGREMKSGTFIVSH